MSRDALPESVRTFLHAHHTLTLATCAGEGPWAAAVFYACGADLSLYFVSDPATRHCRDTAADPRVAATIHAHDQDWRTIRGVQLVGRVEPVAETSRARVERVYLERFPELARALAAPDDAQERRVAERFAAARFFAVKPERLRFIDNSRGFAQREEFDLGPT